MSNKTTDTLIEDIYHLVSTGEIEDGVDVEAEIDKFGEAIKDLMRTEFGRDKKEDRRTLRLSNIGRTDKYLWNVVAGTEKEEMKPNVFVKFMYGHVVEELLLFLTRVAGHEVTHEQQVCEVGGIKGHMDCKIDGVVTDVKSASSFGFKKFKYGTLLKDDPFGYVDQIRAYAHSEGDREVGWLAIDKTTGHLTFLKYDLDGEEFKAHEAFHGTIEERVAHLKEMVKKPEPPTPCYAPKSEGKAGNKQLAMGCSYCQYKKHCYPNLRAFAYSTGPKFFSEIVKEPKVTEIKIHE